uniref:Transposase n=1 Tax=Steinernema glaseri TaxID=37863 RepID=A0A1I7ZZQ2_9BILA
SSMSDWTGDSLLTKELLISKKRNEEPHAYD